MKTNTLLSSLENNDIDVFFLQNIKPNILKAIENKTKAYRIAADESISSAILISWSCMSKIWPSGFVKPLSYYNKCHLRKNGYELISPSLVRQNMTKFGHFYSDTRDIAADTKTFIDL